MKFHMIDTKDLLIKKVLDWSVESTKVMLGTNLHKTFFNNREFKVNAMGS